MSTGEPAETAASRLTDLKLTLSSDVNYQLDSIFPVLQGWFVNGQIKRKHTLIKQAEATLIEVLRPGEQVLYVAKGVQYSFWEQYFLGVWANLINQTVFVLTNARLLLFHTNTKGKPKDMYWMIYYSQIEQFKTSWGALVVKLKDGKTFKFAGFTGTDKKEMPLVFQRAAALYQQQGFNPPVSQSRENLCYFCYVVVPKTDSVCPECGAEYWKPGQIARRSLLFPSWGDFLMRHYLLASIELFGYVISWIVVAGIVLVAFQRGDPDAVAVGLVVLGIFLAFTHIPDAVLTYYIASKGLHRRSPPDVSRIQQLDPQEMSSFDSAKSNDSRGQDSA